MDTISNVKYVDAYYVYDKNVTDTELLVHEAYGYVQRNY